MKITRYISDTEGLSIYVNKIVNTWPYGICLNVKHNYVLNCFKNLLLIIDNTAILNEKIYNNINADLSKYNVLNIFQNRIDILNYSYNYVNTDRENENDIWIDVMYYTDDKDEILKFKLLN